MYKVKAVYDYSSPHEDDLDFKAGQVITVTEEEGDDWYVGEYTDNGGVKHDGLFPRNFVERYEPEPPPRPNRASRYKPLEPPAAQEAPPTPQMPQQEPEPAQPEEPQPPKPQPPPVEVPAIAKNTPLPMSPMSPPSASSAKAPEPLQAQSEAPKPAAPAKKPPPPVAAKSNAFRDRIAAFNAPAAAPIQPFRPSGGAPTNFIKKPFVAPPPSRNAYVPPAREAPPIKTYRREEDPEIAERQARDREDAERAGLVSHDTPNSNEGEEQQQPKISLKERIALLQKQQQEQAERAAAIMKEKPKRPPVVKRAESQDRQADDSEDTGLERVGSGTSKPRASVDQARPRTSQDVKSPDSQAHNRELLSENDADQSGAGDTEDAGAESTSVEGDEERPKSRHPPPPAPRAAAAPAQEPDVGDEQGAVEEDEEEEEEDEMDAETRRKLELRQRMAKMSGGMGMPGMFGGIPMGALPPKPPKPAKKKSITDKKPEESEGYSSPQQPVPMFRIPLPQAQKKEQDEPSLSVEKEEETPHTVTDAHKADEVPDVEDVVAQPVESTPTGDHPPPVPSDKRPAPPPVPSASRPVPPPPPPQVASPGPGSESGDEMTDAANTPSAAVQSPSGKRASYFASGEQQHDLSERRAPPVPTAGPPSAASRPPPPPPPTSAPPSRHADLPIRKLDRTEGETDYEGDYDTDMAPEATHKDALKSHARSSSVEDDTMTDEPTSARSPTIPQGMPPVPPVHRGVPPPPPQQPPGRTSTDAPRGAPPLPPVPPPNRSAHSAEDDDEYDPFKYTGPPPLAASPAPRTVPPPPPPPLQNRPPPPMPPSIPPSLPNQRAESEEEDDLYSSPPPRKSHDRPPPPPPQAPPHQHAPPPLPQQQAPPFPPQERAAPPPPPPQEFHSPQLPPMDPQSRVLSNRKSLDASHLMGTRQSMDQLRSGSMHQDFIAEELDLGASSHWWTQPNLLPPSLQGRKDVIVDMKESQSDNTVEKLIKVLYFDYSQTIISARFEANNVSSVELEQHKEPPPPRQRPDQLENAYEQFGRQIAKAIESKQNTVVGNGTPHVLIEELLKPFADALPPVSTRSYGALVYANLANASTQSFDEIRPGDIISFRNAKFQGKAGPMHARYNMDVGKPDHVAVVVEWDGSKKKVRAWEQGREHKKVKPESFKMGDLRSGEVRVWRVMSKSWIGWN